MKFYLSYNELFEKELFWHLSVCKRKLWLYQIELFELEMFY